MYICQERRSCSGCLHRSFSHIPTSTASILPNVPSLVTATLSVCHVHGITLPAPQKHLQNFDVIQDGRGQATHTPSLSHHHYSAFLYETLSLLTRWIAHQYLRPSCRNCSPFPIPRILQCVQNFGVLRAAFSLAALVEAQRRRGGSTRSREEDAVATLRVSCIRCMDAEHPEAWWSAM